MAQVNKPQAKAGGSAAANRSGTSKNAEAAAAAKPEPNFIVVGIMVLGLYLFMPSIGECWHNIAHRFGESIDFVKLKYLLDKQCPLLIPLDLCYCSFVALLVVFGAIFSFLACFVAWMIYTEFYGRIHKFFFADDVPLLTSLSPV